MGTVDISELIKAGKFNDIRIGGTLILNDRDRDASIAKNTDGTPELFKYYFNEIEWSIGTGNSTVIKYVVIHMPRQKSILTFGDKFTLNNCSLDSLIIYLDSNGIQWNFHFIQKKIVIIKTVDVMVEFVFSYFENENTGLHIIQFPGTV